ncbi:hypothetical protein [Niveibacterium sp. SC-1]|uniref:hypothetical protein n=1 Tax=Niveibacterium sp. SC-1 TaxID=3135646 RepID=UPI00311FDCBC
MSKAERQELLDALRPQATRQAGQPVRFKVDKLNVDHDWAVLVGELMALEGKTLDWNKARDCEPDLDKMLWVVANKQAGAWRVVEMEICASEPPYWYLKPKLAFTRPCGIYAGLETGDEQTPEQQCLAYKARKRPAR